MPYKVFFVEDEIVTREGIRDNVDWTGSGFEYCGDAPDGELALPLLQAARPDVLITDIKMPFMDGLQLCKLVRERLPGMKIVILSGHDEFEYARQAIKLGVTEYLLKPVTSQAIHQALQRVAHQLEQEQEERARLQKLQDQVRENRNALKERLLLKLVVGALSPTEAIEQGQSLGLDLIARCYLVVIVRTELIDRSDHFDYEEYQRIQQLVSDLVEPDPDVFLLRKGWEELVLVMKGDTQEFLEEERDLIIERIQIKAIRSLIAQQVDVIGVAPIVETGWEDVFQEARDAGIPIILVDRRADVPPNLYVTLMGSDFLEEGRKAGRIMAELAGGQATIVELRGTSGSAPANDRNIGFREILSGYPGMRIIASEDANFTVAKGQEVMEAFLKAHGEEITAVFSHNDDMALGAIKAIEAYGLKPGVDIKIMSVDAARGAFEAMIAGKLNATVECNPLLGPQFFELALKVVNGETIPKWIPSEEGVFFPDNAAEILPARKY